MNMNTLVNRVFYILCGMLFTFCIAVIPLKLLDHELYIKNLAEVNYISWHHKFLQTPYAWQYSTGKNIKVAVCDTGSFKHENLSNKIVRYNNPRNSFRESKVTDIGDSYHGTLVTGVIDSQGKHNIFGMSPDATIISIRQSDNPEAEVSYSGVMTCAMKASKLGANIVNISYAPICGDPYWTDFANYIHEKFPKTILNVASGNDGAEVTSDYHSDNLMCISAVNKRGKLSDYSNYGNIIDLSAPGNDIVTPSIDDLYERFTGTSAATPVMSGTMALVWSIDPKLTATEIRNIMINSTILHNHTLYKTENYGYGVINAYDAVMYAKQYTAGLDNVYYDMIFLLLFAIVRIIRIGKKYDEDMDIDIN